MIFSLIQTWYLKTKDTCYFLKVFVKLLQLFSWCVSGKKKSKYFVLNDTTVQKNLDQYDILKKKKKLNWSKERIYTFIMGQRQNQKVKYFLFINESYGFHKNIK